MESWHRPIGALCLCREVGERLHAKKTLLSAHSMPITTLVSAPLVPQTSRHDGAQSAAPHLLASISTDGMLRLWDTRELTSSLDGQVCSLPGSLLLQATFRVAKLAW